MKNQKGFGALEGLLILVIVGLIGFTGWYAFNSKKKTDATLNNAASINTTASSTKAKTAPSPSNTLDAKAASSVVADFYTKYYQATGGSDINATPNVSQMMALIQQYGTNNLLESFNNAKGADPIFCAQATAPVSVTGSSINGSKVVVSLREIYQDSGPINFSADVVNSGGYKIDTVNCPTQ